MCHFLSHEWQPRTQTWPPGAQPSAGALPSRESSWRLSPGWAAAPQTAGFFLAPENLQVGTGF